MSVCFPLRVRQATDWLRPYRRASVILPVATLVLLALGGWVAYSPPISAQPKANNGLPVPAIQHPREQPGVDELALRGQAPSRPEAQGVGTAGPGAAAYPARAVEAPVAGILANPASRVADPELQAILENAAAGFKGELGVVVRHLGTGATAELNAGRRFRAASLYKLFVLYSAFDWIERGSLSRDETLTYSRAAHAAGAAPEWPAGTRINVDHALQAMIKVSNNASADMLVERMGGDARVSDDMKNLGLTQSAFGDDFAYTSAADMALLLEMVASGRAVSPDASREMIGLLKDQRRNDRVPLPLPLGTEVAHKTGELTYLRHDAAIVYASSGPYILVVLADRAENDAAARQVVLDLSASVYAYLNSGGPTQYLGILPRLAREVFRTFDSAGRLEPLHDEWAQTVSVAPAGVVLAEGIKRVNLRELVVPDLLAMQAAAGRDGTGFWVRSGYRAPRGADAPFVLKGSVSLPIQVELPPATPTPAKATPAPAATPVVPSPPPAASQRWLGTVVGVSDSASGEPSAPGYIASGTGRWILEHAWEYGFILTPAETPDGRALGYEPWSLRWVGRGMAARLHELGYERDPSAIATRELRRAEKVLGDPSTWSREEHLSFGDESRSHLATYESGPSKDMGQPLEQLLHSGIRRDAAGRIVEVFGFDPATALEVFYPVTMRRALPAEYEPGDLAPANRFGVPSDRTVRALLGPDLAAMQRDSGSLIRWISGYRTYQYQVEVQERYVRKEMESGLSREEALVQIRNYSAPPGHSQHQLGLAIDFNEIEDSFADTPLGVWLANNAWKYGFVMTYTLPGASRSGYQYEPWHYRWVGKPLAKLMWEQGYLHDVRSIPDDYLEALWGMLAGESPARA